MKDYIYFLLTLHFVDKNCKFCVGDQGRNDCKVIVSCCCT